MRNTFLGNIRPALLLLLLSAAGLGVPGGLAQTTAKGPAKKKTSHGSAPAASKNSSGKSSSTKPAAKTSAINKSAAAPSSHTASSHGAVAHGTSKKTSASNRSRRQPGQKAPTGDRVNEIQSALAKDGSFSGEPSGKWDDSTSDAMRKFQAAHGLNPTGKLDALTLQKLGLGSQTAGVAAPTPPPGSVSRLTSSNSASAATTESARRQ